MINIIVASDIKILCEGLSQLMAQQLDLSIVTMTENPESTLAGLSKFDPDILLLDMTMPRSGELIKQIHNLDFKTKVVALTVSYQESEIMQYAEAGVTCYIPREASITELVKAVRDAVKGEYYCPPKIIECVLKKIKNAGHSAKIGSITNGYHRNLTTDKQLECDQLAKLTSREQQIASLVTKGLSNKKIAQNLCIELSTVKNHIHNILVKLNVKNRSQAIAILKFTGSSYSFVEESFSVN